MKITLIASYLRLEEYMLPCFSKQILGFDCPGCGLQRAILFLSKGDFLMAFKMYPAIYPIMLLFAFLAMNKFFTFKYGNQVISSLMILSVATILINYVLKFI
ncbi:DUF2752 domain-containing protein [Maribacter algicola]|uniref:DUF2752 domain-containing protein n=1 Tax=Meishania litoralis TaxID=3434685 RepID=A0ACC7LNM2_9FLAO